MALDASIRCRSVTNAFELERPQGTDRDGGTPPGRDDRRPPASEEARRRGDGSRRRCAAASRRRAHICRPPLNACSTPPTGCWCAPATTLFRWRPSARRRARTRPSSATTSAPRTGCSWPSPTTSSPTPCGGRASGCPGSPTPMTVWTSWPRRWRPSSTTRPSYRLAVRSAAPASREPADGRGNWPISIAAIAR